MIRTLLSSLPLLCCFAILILINAPAYAQCSNPAGNEGDTIYNGDFVVMQYCDNANWIAMNNDANGLIGYWRLDETSGTSATDSSPNSNNGTMQNGLNASNDSVTGAISNGLQFDGTNDGISVGTPAELNNIWDGGATYAAWLWIDSAGTSFRVANKSPGWLITYNGGSTIRFEINRAGAGGIWDTDNAYPTDQWFHFAATYDADSTANDPVIYFNGVVQTTTENGTPAGARQDDSTTSLTIGDNGLGSRSLPGSIDDVRIYDRILTLAEVQALYNAGRDRGLVAHWKLDETGATTTAIDSSVNGNDGTMNSGLSGTDSVTGKVNTALDFDGVDDRISVGATSDINDIFTGGGTVATWVYFDDYGAGNPRILTKTADITNGWAFTVLSSGNQAWFARRFSGADADWYSTSAVFSLDKWHHMAVTYDEGSTANDPIIYINGVSVPITEINTPTGSAGPDGNDLSMGARHTGVSPHDGYLDDVRLYDRILSANEIFALYAERFNICENPLGHEGDIKYDGDQDVMTYCNGDGWKAMGPVGDGGAGCTNPTGVRGDMLYNDVGNVMQYCEGDDWVAIGK